MDMCKCGACGEVMSEGARCTICDQQLHFHCAGITEAGYRKLGDRRLTWRCIKCKQIGSNQPTSPRPELESQLLSEIRAISLRLAPLENLKDELIALRAEFAELKSFMVDTNQVLKEFGSKFKEFEQRLVQVEKTQCQVDLIQSRLDKLEQDTNSADQWSRLNNIELKGIPQSNNENLFDIVSKISAQIQYSVNKTQINFVTRVPTREKDNPKPIVVSFCNRYVKEDFVAAARYAQKTTPLTTGVLGFPGQKRVYVNDHLTLQNKSLLAKTKKAAAANNFQYVWVKHSKIHARKSDTSHVIIVHSDKDVAKIM